MADEQSSTLAFLQNFYTDVTLYMPFEAHERATPAPAAESTAAPAPVVPIAVAPALPAPIAPPVPMAAPTPVVAAPAMPMRVPAPPVPVAPPLPATASKLPSLAGTGLAPAAQAAPAPVVTQAPAAPVASTATEVPAYLLTTFSTLGSNAQGVVILVRLPPEQFIKLTRNVFLNNLLKAIGLVMADVVLVNVESPYPVALQNLRKEIAATRILAFGKNLLDVAVRTTQIYEPVHFPAVGMDFIAGAEIAMIEYDTSLKKRLWGGLQPMFLK